MAKRVRDVDAVVSTEGAQICFADTGEPYMRVKVARVLDDDGIEHFGILAGMSKKKQRLVFRQKDTQHQRLHPILIIEGPLFKSLRSEYPAYYKGEGYCASAMSLLGLDRLKYEFVLDISEDPIKQGLRKLKELMFQ